MTGTVGVVGLGNIGGRIAAVLLEEFDVVGYDLDEERCRELADEGGTVADSVQEVGRQASVVLLSLPSDEALEATVFGDESVLDGMADGDVLVDTSTVSPMLSRRVGEKCEAAGVGFLDAPVSGGARNAERGTLTLLVGGPEETLEQVQPVLDAIGKTIHHVGQTGTGVTLKVVNNYMFGLNQAVLAEGLTMARAAGIDDETFAETVADSSGASYALDRNMERFVLPDEYDSEFTLGLMEKDVQLGEAFASAQDVPLLVGGASEVYQLGEAMGYGDLDSAAILKLYEDIAQSAQE